MGIISWIIIGGLAGWVASMILKVNGQQGILGNIIAGILGALLGGWIMNAIGSYGITGFDFRSFLVALGGAIVVLILKGTLTGHRAM
jgi:uncharacterized membrane protein YeaQ/YmgE (transglycosylase-associated protein family)